MKTVAELIDDMRAYPQDAEVTSALVKVVTPRSHSTYTYSARLAKQLAELKASRA